MRRIIGLVVISVISVMAFLIISANYYLHTIKMDMQNLEDYVLEYNTINKDYIYKNQNVSDNKGEYIHRLILVQKGLKNTRVSYFMNKYRKNKISSIDSLINSISEGDKNDKVNLYKLNKMSNVELNKLTFLN